jgi:hypothetical protein
MLINPYRERLGVMDGTPFVSDRALLGSIGAVVPSQDPRRLWTIQSFLLPSQHRALGGLRVKVQDQKGFVSFINQRDLEVLLGHGQPGEPCYWLGRNYVEPGDKDWVGFLADEEDLLDDLYERELIIRSDYPLVPEGTNITRRVHIDRGNDFEETWMLLFDGDRETGLYPDPRYETVENRWVRVERVRVSWGSL